MPKQIAVFVGDNGETTTLYEQGNLIVYQKNQGRWTELRQQEFVLDKSSGMKELRAGMDAAIEFLGECDTFVARSVVGVPYFSLEKAGFSVWEFEGRPVEFLDYILEQEEEARAAEAERQGNNVIPLPVEIGDGRFRISLKEIQANNSGFTSKQVLQPFLRKGRFYELEVLCGHVPPWLEAELAAGNMAGEVEKINRDEIKVTIYKKTCDQC